MGAAWQVGPTGAQGRALSPSCNFLAQAHRLKGSGSNVTLFPICLLFVLSGILTGDTAESRPLSGGRKRRCGAGRPRRDFPQGVLRRGGGAEVRPALSGFFPAP